jgi:hypothetical protein
MIDTPLPACLSTERHKEAAPADQTDAGCLKGKSMPFDNNDPPVRLRQNHLLFMGDAAHQLARPGQLVLPRWLQRFSYTG